MSYHESMKIVLLEMRAESYGVWCFVCPLWKAMLNVIGFLVLMVAEIDWVIHELGNLMFGCYNAHHYADLRVIIVVQWFIEVETRYYMYMIVFRGNKYSGSHDYQTSMDWKRGNWEEFWL